MYPLTHFLVAFFIGLIMVKYGSFTLLQALYAGLVGLLIDVDHFISFVIKKDDFSLKHAWNATVKYKLEERTFIHHFPGFIIVSLILLLLYFIGGPWFWILLIGYYSHIFLDYFNFRKWLRLKRKSLNFKEEGFFFKIPIYEIVFDVIFIALILFLLL
ncbi:metal-dependent hydrolase [Candidatus Woesearchaeota archaeon]|nr:metal-dependent hydrolase [Candidatus Woesearchaeota archaeon]MBT4321885.1 metal-dependent hydrolase [Candidatus Woesearchaeota archaeon]